MIPDWSTYTLPVHTTNFPQTILTKLDAYTQNQQKCNR